MRRKWMSVIENPIIKEFHYDMDRLTVARDEQGELWFGVNHLRAILEYHLFMSSEADYIRENCNNLRIIETTYEDKRFRIIVVHESELQKVISGAFHNNTAIAVSEWINNIVIPTMKE